MMVEQTIDFRQREGDSRLFRRALGCFATGVTVVTTRTGEGKLEGVTVNSFSSVSLDPPLVLWSLQCSAPSLASFLNSGRFAVNVLGAEQRALSNHFATRKPDKFEGIDHEAGLGGCPLLVDSLARFECRIENTFDGGDHVIFLGRVERTTFREGKPLVFSHGAYCVTESLREDAR